MTVLWTAHWEVCLSRTQKAIAVDPLFDNWTAGRLDEHFVSLYLSQENCRKYLQIYCRYVQLTYHSSIVPFLPLQTRTLCSAMRRQMAIQLFIARMGSWIWQDIHARKLCKRVRTDRRTDGQLNTSILIWMYLYILFNCLPTTTTTTWNAQNNVANRLLMSFPLRPGYEGGAQTANWEKSLEQDGT